MDKDLVAQLNRIFYPRAAAIIGASADKGKFGYVFLDSFIKAGFKDIYPINPRETEILGLPAYPSVTQVPGEVDYAVISTPPSAVLQAITDCAEKRVAGVSIYTSGFREKGPEGRELEKEIVEAAHRGGTRIIGPNCMGIYCPASRLTMFGANSLVSGSIGLISHSGSMCSMLSHMIPRFGLAVNKAVSCGNESDLNFVDFLEYFGQDPQIEVIIGYMEGVKDGQRFVNLAREISQQKPIIILKSGLTERGARAAASHTGAMAGSREVWQGAFRQTGITLVRSVEELMDCLLTLSVSTLPAGRGAAIVGGPGGPAVAASDAIVEHGLTLGELSQATRERMSQLIPAVGTSIDNPLDLGQSVLFTPRVYAEAIIVAGEDPSIDMILSIGGNRPTRSALAEAKKQLNKPMVLAMGFGHDATPEDYKFHNEAGIAVISDPRRGARVLSVLADRADFIKRTGSKKAPVYHKVKPHEALATARCDGREALSEFDSKRLLASYGVPTTKEELAQSRRQALAAAARIGFPVGLKACGSHILHKTELGLVELNLADTKEVGVAYDLLMERAAAMFPDGILVQEMVRGSREFVVGLVQDHQFGPCVMFGLGGIFTEALRDVSFRVAPFDKDEAIQMIGEIRAQALLGPFRGSEPVDVDALADILLALSRLAFEQEDVNEIDINPLIVGPDGRPIAVDALVALT